MDWDYWIQKHVVRAVLMYRVCKKDKFYIFFSHKTTKTFSWIYKNGNDNPVWQT